MKIKTILLGASLAAIVATAQAQTNPVYSVNVVGYTKLTLPAGFTMFANHMNTATNTLNSLLGSSGLAPGTTVYTFNRGTGSFDSHTFTGSAWIPDGSLAPGQGGFIQLAAPSMVIFAGEVTLGTNSNLSIPQGFSIISSKVPQSATLSALLLTPATPGDTVYRFNSGTSQYNSSTWTGSSWIPNPTLNIGESFFIQTQQPFNWNRDFVVN